jgi:hypothetical protein
MYASSVMDKSYESCEPPSSIPSRCCRSGVTGCLDPLSANVNIATKCDVTRRQGQTPDFCHQTPVLVLDFRTWRLVVAVPGQGCATDGISSRRCNSLLDQYATADLGGRKNSSSCKQDDPGPVLQPSTAAHSILDMYQTKLVNYGVLFNAPVHCCIIVLASFRFGIEFALRF